MALPEGVTTATVIAGVPVTHTGAGVKAFVSIEPSAFLVHAATGTPLVDFIEEMDISEGTAGQFILPHTDQAGFEDGSGNAYTNWFYTARITYSTPSKAKTKAPKVKVFQLTTGQTSVDLDKLPAGAPALPYIAPTAKVDAFNGRTGAVELLESDLPERLTDTALNATIATATAGKLDGKDYDAMRAFRAAVGDRSGGGCRIYVRGSSTAEGAMATTYDKTWQRILVNTLRERYPARAGVTHDTGAGFWPPYYQMEPYPARVGTASGAHPTFTTSGLAGKGQFIPVGQTRTFTFTGTHFDIWYNKLNEATTMTYTVDGGAAVDVNIQNAAVAVSTVQVGPLTAGEHTVVIGNKAGSAGSVPFLGFMSYNGSRTAGFHLWEGGFSGRHTAQWTDSSSVNFERWTDAVALINPNLVIDVPFLNDVVLGGGSAAAAKTAQQAIIDKINSKVAPDPTYLIVLGWLRKDVPEQNDPWTLYKEKAYELAATNPNVCVLDVGDAVGTPLDKSLSIWQDDIHLNDKGMGLLADLIADYLTAR